MKILLNNHFRLTLILFTTLFLTAGCGAWLMKSSSGTVSQPTDPLAGWTSRGFDDYLPSLQRHHYHLDKAITDDYQNFIEKNKLDLFGAITGFYEDGTGQHAVEFEAFPDKQNATWHYVIIYDKENKRVKVIKYGYRRFVS
jgi:hypothetical protein